MAVNDQYDFLDLEEPKSPTLSVDLDALLSQSDVPLPYLSKNKTVFGVSPELEAPTPRHKLWPEKTSDPGSDRPDNKPTCKISHKTPSIDLSSLRVRITECANPASQEMASASKSNSQQSTGKRFDHSVPAGRVALGPWTGTGDLPAKQGFKSSNGSVFAATSAMAVDEGSVVSIDNVITVDLVSQETRTAAPLSGKMSDLFTGGQVAAVEPSKEFISVNGEPYQVIKLLGEGGSSKVYEVFSSEMELMAIKCVNLRTADQSACEGYRNEISVLGRLQGSDRIIKLYDHEFNEGTKMLYVVLERGEVDLATIIASNTKQKRITPEMVKFYWSEMLRAVKVIHKAGIIHSDLKPANFLLVAGQLKLIDFGIASTIPTDATSIIKDTRSGTPSYMSPEAFLDTREDGEGDLKIKLGVKSDVWSLGCILYHLVYKCTPFHHIRDPMKKMLSIVNPNHEITFPPLNDLHLLDVLKRCIVRDPKQRASISELLQHPYLTATTRLQHPLASLMNSISELSPTSIQKISQVVGELKKK